ncbi:toprim domain-containing protein [Priestia aryabhattai]|uniref:toprim domain-containing protein n=1 Tax=Priestia aryabhattai TaxID=412384 RepID=UPI0028815F34|nr:toprim domain-containing protein [Priestia aryabhattai]MDT0150053.1 toprim domain-containing protein [Priestia aryabhattai]MDT0155623.1 toprim domain-containing protein [Priestia aryabhattai]
MILRNVDLDIDFLEELEAFDVWNKQRLRENEFQACSPFRNEAHPSFSVNLETGLWVDFGSVYEDTKSGNFVKLLSYLREETATETIDYLLEKYAPFNVDVETLSLNMNLSLEEPEPVIFERDTLEHFFVESEYLKGRGVNPVAQQMLDAGHDAKHNAVVLPWHDKDGRIVNVKFRSIKQKYFWYMDGQQIKNHVYGLWLVRKLNKDTVFIVESEIDALYLWSLGYAAIALGRARISRKQRELILNSGIKTLIIATDNDRAGRSCGLELIRELGGYIDLRCIDFPNNVKDVNDMAKDVCKTVCNNHRRINFKVL